MSYNIPNPKLNTENSFFNSKYADLGEIMRTVTPFLNKNGCDIQQTTLLADQTLMFITRLIDVDGKVMREVAFPFPATGKAQELGSALTYCRRYGVALLFNLVAETDDDGNAASGKTKAKAKSRGRKPATKKATPPKETETTTLVNDDSDDEGDWY